MKKTEVSASELVALEQRKRESVLQLLLKASRLSNEQAVARMQAEGERSVRLAHTRLLPHLDFEGTRITDLAERTGVTKQAVAKMIHELEAQGVVRRVPDPRDGRAKLVRITKKGLRGIHHGLSVLDGMERDIEATLGARAMAQLGEHLAALIQLLEGEEGYR